MFGATSFAAAPLGAPPSSGAPPEPPTPSVAGRMKLRTIGTSSPSGR